MEAQIENCLKFLILNLALKVFDWHLEQKNDYSLNSKIWRWTWWLFSGGNLDTHLSKSTFSKLSAISKSH